MIITWNYQIFIIFYDSGIEFFDFHDCLDSVMEFNDLHDFHYSFKKLQDFLDFLQKVVL